MDNQFYCPKHKVPLEYAYNKDGHKVYYCPDGDEHYYFQEQNGCYYPVCVWDGGEVQF